MDTRLATDCTIIFFNVRTGLMCRVVHVTDFRTMWDFDRKFLIIIHRILSEKSWLRF